MLLFSLLFEPIVRRCSAELRAIFLWLTLIHQLIGCFHSTVRMILATIIVPLVVVCIILPSILVIATHFVRLLFRFRGVQDGLWPFVICIIVSAMMIALESSIAHGIAVIILSVQRDIVHISGGIVFTVSGLVIANRHVVIFRLSFSALLLLIVLLLVISARVSTLAVACSELCLPSGGRPIVSIVPRLVVIVPSGRSTGAIASTIATVIVASSAGIIEPLASSRATTFTRTFIATAPILLPSPSTVTFVAVVASVVAPTARAIVPVATIVGAIVVTTRVVTIAIFVAIEEATLLLLPVFIEKLTTTLLLLVVISSEPVAKHSAASTLLLVAERSIATLVAPGEVTVSTSRIVVEPILLEVSAASRKVCVPVAKIYAETRESQ